MDKVYCGSCNRELVPTVNEAVQGSAMMEYHPCPIHWDQVATNRQPGQVLTLDESPPRIKTAVSENERP